MDPYLAQVLFWGLSFNPVGWMSCDGRLLPIASYNALFALIGTTYGGDGVTTFALPDLRGRVPVGQGQGIGLSPRFLGQTGGQENVTLLPSQIPGHVHVLSASAATPTTAAPAGSALPTGASRIYASGAAGVAMSPTSIAASGSGASHPNQQPYLTLNPQICVEGIFPSRT